MKLTAIIVSVAGLAFVVMASWVMLEQPPRIWYDYDYENRRGIDLKNDLPGYAGDYSFKYGWGWIHEGVFVKSHLRAFAHNEYPEDQDKVTDVYVHRWLKLPFLGEYRFSNQDLYMTREVYADLTALKVRHHIKTKGNAPRDVSEGRAYADGRLPATHPRTGKLIAYTRYDIQPEPEYAHYGAVTLIMGSNGSGYVLFGTEQNLKVLDYGE